MTELETKTAHTPGTYEGIESECEAYARLIAAAPSLLAACEALEELLTAHNWGDGPARRAAQAAIAKARGETI